MATVFMKWLETSPKDYDRGIQWLTLGRIRQIKDRIAKDYVRAGMRVLEIGCGTGTLTRMMAQRGALVTSIDASPWMLAEAEKKVKAANLEEQVALKHMDAAMVGDHFPAASFDLIVSTLVFSELPLNDQRFVLEACRKLLAPDGQLVIADEVIPARSSVRLFFYLVRLPLLLLTWLITRTSTHSLHEFDLLLTQTGFHTETAASYLGGSLVLYKSLPARAGGLESALPPTVIGVLRHRVTLRTLLLDLWLLFFRIIPPYPKVRTGLYAVGQPDADSPVLVTGNFDLTVRRLVQAIDGKVNAWLLVADSAGINVWCAAGGGYFTAEKVIAAVKSSRLDEVVNHRALILPQLCANGVDGWRIRKETGWGIHWGPVRAVDIPAYLAGERKKTDEMRRVVFPLKDRLEMVTVTMGFYGLLILLPVLIFWRHMFWPITFSVFGLSYFYAIVHPWLPGRDGLYKSIPLALISLAGLFAYSALFGPLPDQQLFHWMVGLTGLSVFSAAELQGMSPLMRGEQANWSWELVIGLGLGALYWLIPLVLGWR
ncbi:MAG: methyltransferase domain-containing protein [Anaerolineae bacterium]|nr:methyltransferase domain-containing protein [Anaerolineae bacterium]